MHSSLRSGIPTRTAIFVFRLQTVGKRIQSALAASIVPGSFALIDGVLQAMLGR